MTLKNHYKVKRWGSSAVLYDDQLINDPCPQVFDGDFLMNEEAYVTGCSAEVGFGRANVVYFVHNDTPMVLKHYYRGGAIAKLINDRYFGLNIENSRSFNEWRLLKKMRSLNLPVPDAIAAHAKRGGCFFQCDLITRRLEDTKTLSDMLIEGALSSKQWRRVGACIKMFHDNNIYHADLNARNILINLQGEVFLIDFDNSYIRSSRGSWRMSNLIRLERSLEKIKRNEIDFHFEARDWSALLMGYQ